MSTDVSPERLLDTTEMSSCDMSTVNTSYLSDIENTGCPSVPLGLSGIEGGLGEGLILVFTGSKMVI